MLELKSEYSFTILDKIIPQHFLLLSYIIFQSRLKYTNQSVECFQEVQFKGNINAESESVEKDILFLKMYLTDYATTHQHQAIII